MKSILKNLIYGLLLQIATLVIPIITLPYITRILGAEGIGTNSFTLSITKYFIILGSLGLSIYGNRQIAYTRDDKTKMSVNFWSILLLRIITTGIAFLVYLIVFINIRTYRSIFLIQSINILAAMIDISWLYMGLEDFKKTVTRNLSIKTIGVVLIFLLVKDVHDLHLYIWINVIMLLLGNAVMWIYIPKTVCKVKLQIKDLTEHIVPTIKMFIPQIAIQVYAILDKTMIGYLSNITEVGYYEQAENIVKAVLGLITVAGTVMLPRMSNIFSKGLNDKMDEYLNISLKGIAYVAVPISIGIASISKGFVPWYFGFGFDKVGYIMIILSPITFFISMSNVMGMQYLVPSNRTKEFTISVVFGAIINVFMNLILIVHFAALGAAIATIVAECSVTIIQYYFLRKEIRIKGYILAFIKYLLASTFMYIVVKIIGFYYDACFATTVLQCFIGFITYVLVLIILKEDINKLIIQKVLMKIRRESYEK